MKKYVVFDTPGLIDLRSFTVMGFNSKPTVVNPIGFFGTGLKLSVAVLARLGIPMIVWIGDVKYVFYSKTEDFRGKEFHRLYMRREKVSILDKITKSVKPLDYTTEFGKTWQLWMVFREIESNTRDENGVSYVLDSAPSAPSEGFTRIIIESEDMARIWDERSRIFLDAEVQKIEDSPYAEIIDRPGQHVYYRGQRAHDLPEKKPSLFTYNIIGKLELTEDRTIKNGYSMNSEIAKAVAMSDNAEMIRKVLTAPDGTLEKELDFSYSYVEPSETFKEVVRQNKQSVSRSARAYVGSHGGYYGSSEPPGIQDILSRYPLPWRKTDLGILDKNSVLILSKGPYNEWDWGEFDALCSEILRAMSSMVADDEAVDKITEERLLAENAGDSHPQMGLPESFEEPGPIQPGFESDMPF